MSWYKHIETGRVEPIDDALFTAWREANNPKANAWVSIPDQPTPDAWWNGEEWKCFTPPPIEVISMRQARLALLSAGLLATVDTAVSQAGAEAQIEWEYATEIRRDWPLVLQLAEVLNLDLDTLFQTASQL